MRREEFDINDKKTLIGFLSEQEFGTLCLPDKQYPYAVPLNFVYFKDKIYFHGAQQGRKYNIIKDGKSCSFSVVKALSLIPSYFFNTKLACSATQFFASAFFEGDICILKNNVDKAEAIQALMEKLQKEDSFLNIVENIEKYQKMLFKTVVYELTLKSWSLKIKAGQNLNSEKKKVLLNNLNLSNNNCDKDTIQNIKKYSLKD